MLECLLCKYQHPENVGVYTPADRPSRTYVYRICDRCLQRPDSLKEVERHCDSLGRRLDLIRAAPLN